MGASLIEKFPASLNKVIVLPFRRLVSTSPTMRRPPSIVPAHLLILNMMFTGAF